MVRLGQAQLAALPQKASETLSRLSDAILGNDKAELASGLQRHLAPAVAHFSDNIAERGQGTYVWTTDGRRHLDFACGIGVTSTGHSHPKVVKAIQDQAADIIFAQQNVFLGSKPLAGLVDRLLGIVPDQLSRFIFANSGSEAVENAVKVARAHTKRRGIIAFENSFHGRTMGAMALTTSKTYYRQQFGPLMPDVYVAPYPYCLHCKVRQAHADGSNWYMMEPCIPPFRAYHERTCCNGPQEALQWLLKQQITPQETAAIIVEPIMGEGGFLTPPRSFFENLRSICDQHGILLIMDEVQAGVGRTGKWWGHQHVTDLQPDLMCFAKGIASGFPFAGVAAKSHLLEGQPPGTLGGTYGAGPLGCAAANATIDAIEEEGLLDNATARGSQLVQGLVRLASRFPISDVRGRGLMVAAEFGGADGGLTAKAGVASAVTKACLARDMLLLTAGARETVRFLPPLNVSAAEVDEALHIFEGALTDVFGKQSAHASFENEETKANKARAGS